MEMKEIEQHFLKQTNMLFIMMAVLIANLKIKKEQWIVHCATEMKSVWLDTVTIKIIMTQYAWIIKVKSKNAIPSKRITISFRV